tara:strand:+ start:26456 stop:28276 length:1821 start_codon:yes stop_codon:yes gene_type:complete
MSWLHNAVDMEKLQTTLSFPGAVLGGIASYTNSINPFNSLNAFRLTGDYRYNESRLEQMSPAHKEVMINSYNSTLGIPKPGTFQEHVNQYLKDQDAVLNTKIGDPTQLSQAQNNTYAQLETLKAALRTQLENFTGKITNLPSNTHAEALANEATEEKRRILDKLKLLNQQTEAFTSGLTTPNTTNSTNPANTTTPGTTNAGGAGAGTGVGTTATSNPAPGTTPNILSGQAAQNILNNLSTPPPSTPELDKLEKKLTGTITDMQRAAQLERDRIPVFATLQANKRKQQLFTRTIGRLPNPARLFKQKKANPPSVLVTGDDQAGVDNLRAAMRLLDLPGQDQEALKEAKKNLDQTETRLKKATEDNDQDKIDQYTQEKKDHEETIKKLNQHTSPQQIQQAAAMMNGGSAWELFGYNPGLTALSGKKITVTASEQGLGFSMHFPRPMFDPGYYTSSQHNTKGDLLSMVELIKATGAEKITVTIKCDNPKMALRLAQEAYEATLEVGFDKDKITIFMNGQEMTADKLYQDSDQQSKPDPSKYMAKKQRAEKLQGIASQGRAAVKAKHGEEIKTQQASLKNALQSGRDELDAAFNNNSNPPTPSSTTIVNP